MPFRTFWEQRRHRHSVILFQHLLRLSSCGPILLKRSQNGQISFNLVLTSWRTIKTDLVMFIFLQWVSFYSSFVCSSNLSWTAIDPGNKLSFLRDQSDQEYERGKRIFLNAVTSNFYFTLYPTECSMWLGSVLRWPFTCRSSWPCTSCSSWSH